MPKDGLFYLSPREPRRINAEMIIGAVAGTFVLPVIGTVIGGWLGGKIGEGRMTREAEQGMLVSEPRAVNRDGIAGGMLGFGLSTLAAGALISSGALWAPVAIVLGAAAVVGGTALGARLGSSNGQNRMLLDYERARHMQHEMSQNPDVPDRYVGKSESKDINTNVARDASLGIDETPVVTPEESALLDARLRDSTTQATEHSFTEAEQTRRDTIEQGGPSNAIH